MSQSNRKSIALLSDFERGHNKSVENSAFALILKLTHLCMVYALIIQPYWGTKRREMDVS